MFLHASTVYISTAQNRLIKYLLRPQQKLRKGYVFTGVCLSTGGRGVHHPGQTPPHTPPPRQTATAADGTHATRMHSSLDYLSDQLFPFLISHNRSASQVTET